MKFPWRTSVLAGLAAASLALPALAASAATVPVNYANNASGIEVTGGSYEAVQTVYTLPTVTPPNGQTALAVYLGDASQSVVLSLGPVNGTGAAYTASLAQEDPTPGLAPGYTTGFTDTSPYAYAAGDKVEVALSYDGTSQVTYTITNLTDVTVPVYRSSFTDTGQVFDQAFAGTLFAGSVYGTPTSFIQPAVKTVLIRGTHTQVLDTTGADVTGAAKVRTSAGGVKLGTKLTAVSVASSDKSFTVSLLP